MITDDDYRFLATFLHERSGLHLTEGKEYLLQGRLVPVAKRLGMATVGDIAVELRRNKYGDLADEVVEAMTTNETLFFRDKTPFEELQQIMLPEAIEKNRVSRKLRIWCAACSTGQEPYTISMILHDAFPELATWNIEILGTDLSKGALEKAREGVYSQFEAQRGLPIQHLVNHFEQNPRGWRVKDHLRRWTKWQSLNLLEKFDALGTFDIIFCRNVLIYFNVDGKANILDRLAHRLHPDGHLILGAAESVLGITTKFDRNSRFRSAVYRHLNASTTPVPSAIGARVGVRN